MQFLLCFKIDALKKLAFFVVGKWVVWSSRTVLAKKGLIKLDFLKIFKAALSINIKIALLSYVKQKIRTVQYTTHFVLI